MKNIVALHDVKDTGKLNTLITSMANGWNGRKILAVDCGDHLQALTGSHRIAAANELDIEIPVMVIDIDELCDNEDMTIDEIMTNLDYFYTLLVDYNVEASELLLKDL